MAPVNQNMKDKGKLARNDGKGGQANQRAGNVNKQKRKWVPDYKRFDGSVGEGQGFAFLRRKKVQHEYNKLLRKERRKNKEVKTPYRDEYPEHLRHLYVAEAEKLNNEDWMNRVKRSQGRMDVLEGEVTEDMAVNEAPAEVAPPTDTVADPGVSVDPGVSTDPGLSTDQTAIATQQPEPSVATKVDRLPMSGRQKKKMMRKTSFQKMEEEFETIKEKRSKKEEEFLKNKQQRDEAIQKYKQKKMEKEKILKTKTQKGQPNLNRHMEYLLQKIQESGK